MSDSILLGVIAEDAAGAAELAIALARSGMKTLQVMGVPAEGVDFGEAEAVVVALDRAAATSEEVIAMALAAVLALRSAGAQQVLLSAFSDFSPAPLATMAGVAAALMELLGAPIAIACLAEPGAGRTVYQGHGFSGSQLISAATGQDAAAPQQSNLVELLQAQTSLRVGLLPFDMVAAGSGVINAVLHRAEQAGFKLMVADAVRDRDLTVLGAALAGARLVLGGAGIAVALAQNFRAQGVLGDAVAARTLAVPAGRAVVLAGSSAPSTLAQVEHAIDAGCAALQLVPSDIAAGRQNVADIANWVLVQPAGGPVLIYSSATAEAVQAAHDALGAEEAGLLVEHMLANLAVVLRDNGFARFLVAGDATGSAVRRALGVTLLRVGPEIVPGVAWFGAVDRSGVALAVKAGERGEDDLFLSSWAALEA